MQAMHGSAVLFRTRNRVIGCSMAIGLALSALVLMFASSASAKTPPPTYLATGDSLAFGYSQQLFNENFPTEDPKAFEHGYVNDFFKLEQATAKGWHLVNNGCPGETTDSMIGNGPLKEEMAALGATGEAPCAYHYLAKFRLHHEYGKPQPTFNRSQLESAMQVLKKEFSGKKAKPVKELTLNIGANDELKAVGKCEAEVKSEYEKEGKSKYGATPEEAVKNCLAVNAFPLFKHILTNISAMLYVIRNGSKYCVNANAAFSCDAKHKGIDYAGKILVQGGYDPYGRVFCAGESFASEGNAPESCVPGPELLPESNSLVAILNFQEAKAVEPFMACYANPQPTFNPALVGKPDNEPFKLQTLTNMDNKTTSNGKPNGDGKKNDIHPTPLGYTTLSNIMSAACGL